MEKILFFIGVVAVTLGITLMVLRYLLRFILDNLMFNKLEAGEEIDESACVVSSKEELSKILGTDLSPQVKMNCYVLSRRPSRIETILKHVGSETTRIGLILIVGAFYQIFPNVWLFCSALLVCIWLPYLINQLVLLATMFIWVVFKLLWSGIQLFLLVLRFILLQGMRAFLKIRYRVHRWFLLRRLTKEGRYWYNLIEKRYRKNNINI